MKETNKQMKENICNIYNRGLNVISREFQWSIRKRQSTFFKMGTWYNQAIHRMLTKLAKYIKKTSCL